MNHYTYKITNTKTNEFYVGVRSCKYAIEDDKYMGSSSVWTKSYIKENKDVLKKEIIEVFETRKLANGGEIQLLKLVESDPLCINLYFDYTPDVSGIKQTPEHIAKRIHSGEQASFYGHHHSEETKKIISEKMKERIMTETHKERISKALKGKMKSAEHLKNLSKAKQKTYVIINKVTGYEFIGKILEFIELHPEEELRAQSFRDAACGKRPFYKHYLIRAATDSDISRKLGKNGETLEVDNPVGSLGSV